MRSHFIRSFSAKEKKMRRVRDKMRSSGRLRISISRSNRHFYVQIINDALGVTLVSASSLEKEMRDVCGKRVNVDAVKAVAAFLVKKFDPKKEDCGYVFDRGSYKYSGIISVFADALRSGGFKF